MLLEDAIKFSQVLDRLDGEQISPFHKRYVVTPIIRCGYWCIVSKHVDNTYSYLIQTESGRSTAGQFIKYEDLPAEFLERSDWDIL
jgi:hypothetical protein